MMVCGQVTLALGAPCGRERLFDGHRCRGPRDLDRSGREFIRVVVSALLSDGDLPAAAVAQSYAAAESRSGLQGNVARAGCLRNLHRGCREARFDALLDL